MDLIKAQPGACSPDLRKKLLEKHTTYDGHISKLEEHLSGLEAQPSTAALKKDIQHAKLGIQKLVKKRDTVRNALERLEGGEATTVRSPSSWVTGEQFKNRVALKKRQITEQVRKDVEAQAKEAGYDSDFSDLIQTRVDKELQGWLDKTHPGRDMGESIEVPQKMFSVTMKGADDEGNPIVHRVVVDAEDIDGNPIPSAELEKIAQEKAGQYAKFKFNNDVKQLSGVGQAAPKKEKKRRASKQVPRTLRGPGLHIDPSGSNSRRAKVELVGENGEVLRSAWVTKRADGDSKPLSKKMILEVANSKLAEAEEIDAEGELLDQEEASRKTAFTKKPAKKELTTISSFDDLLHHDDVPVKTHAQTFSDYKKLVSDFYRNNRVKESIEETAKNRINQLASTRRRDLNKPGADRTKVDGKFRTKKAAVEKKKKSLLEEINNRMSTRTLREEHKNSVSEATRLNKKGEHMYPETAEEVPSNVLQDYNLPYLQIARDRRGNFIPQVKDEDLKHDAKGRPILTETDKPVVEKAPPKRKSPQQTLREAGVDEDIIGGVTKRAGTRLDDPDPGTPTEKKKLISKDYDKHYASTHSIIDSAPDEVFSGWSKQKLLSEFGDAHQEQDRSGSNKKTQLRKKYGVEGLQGEELKAHPSYDAMQKEYTDWHESYFSGSRGTTTAEDQGIKALKNWADTFRSRIRDRRSAALKDIGIFSTSLPDRVTEDQIAQLNKMSVAEDRAKAKLAEMLSSRNEGTFGDLSEQGQQEVLAYLQKSVNNTLNLTDGILMPGLFLNTALFKALRLSEEQKIQAFENSFGRDSGGVGPATMNTGEIEAEEEKKDEQKAKDKMSKGLGLYVSC